MNDLQNQQSLFDDIDLAELTTTSTTSPAAAAWTEDWTAIRITKDQKARLETIQAAMEKHYARTGAGLPDGTNPDYIPLNAVLEKVLAEYEDHKERSRAAAARRRKS